MSGCADDEKICPEQEQVSVTGEPVATPIDDCTLVQGALEDRGEFDYDADSYSIGPDEERRKVTVTLTERGKDTCPADVDVTLVVNRTTSSREQGSMTEDGCPQVTVRLEQEFMANAPRENFVIVRGSMPSRAFEYDIHIEYGD
ncbi:MAG: hypothetical protein HOV80_18555 [Polyangiaceae bacterium]|nr:hypothetical protein [Polyangiaceae bacterium]